MAASLLPVMLGLATGAQDWSKVWSGVLESCSDVSCVRRRVDDAMDRALNMSSITLAPGVTLVPSADTTALTEGSAARGTEDVMDKAVRFFTTRDININLRQLEEGRGRRKKYSEFYYAAAIIAAFLIPLKLQALAVVAGKALIIAKVALALAGSSILKKLSYSDHHRRVDVADPPYYIYNDHQARVK